MRRSLEQGCLASGVDVQAAAAFIVASLEGCIGMAKNGQSKEILLTCGRGLTAYLHSLQSES